jgi:hypothetical protein
MGHKLKELMFSETLLEYQVSWKMCCFFLIVSKFVRVLKEKAQTQTEK